MPLAGQWTPELVAKEQEAIVKYLEKNPSAQTFYVFDAETGKRAFTAPILWVGGCQGVGTPPAITADGRAVVIHRSAYGNWNHGVAPLVARKRQLEGEPAVFALTDLFQPEHGGFSFDQRIGTREPHLQHERPTAQDGTAMTML